MPSERNKTKERRTSRSVERRKHREKERHNKERGSSGAIGTGGGTGGAVGTGGKEKEVRHKSRSKERDRTTKKARSRSRDEGRKDKHKERRREEKKQKRRDVSKDAEKGEEKRTKSRSRSHSKEKKRNRKSAFSDPAAAGQTQSLQQLQQQQLQRQLLAQQLLFQQQALTGSNALIANKKQREVYVGNLTIGIVNADMLRELFNGALSSLVPDPVTNPPVVSVNMDASGRFGFVELRSEELANAAMQMDKVELCGRHVNIGRPRGYVEPPTSAVSQSKYRFPSIYDPTGINTPSTVVLLTNLLTVSDIEDSNERFELVEEVRHECEKWATILGMACPHPPEGVDSGEPCRVYVKHASVDEAIKTREYMDKRTFDKNTVKAIFVLEYEFTQAMNGEWVETMSPSSSK